MFVQMTLKIQELCTGSCKVGPLFVSSLTQVPAAVNEN